ncbi:MAG: DUF819 family protein [Bacteroidota bacterium]
MADSLYVLTALCLIVVLTEWLVRKTFFRHFGTALLVILITAIIANIGLLPAGSSAENPVPIYDGIFSFIAPISIFWLLLRVNLRDILKAGFPLIILFLIGAIGTTVGVVGGMSIINGAENIGENFAAVGGMFTGTYTGGSINFNAVALHYDVVREGVLYGGSVAVDNILTAIWMIATLAIPRLLSKFWPKNKSMKNSGESPLTGIDEDTEELHPIDLGLVLALGVGSLLVANLLAEISGVPSIIIITIIALVIAQIPAAKKIKGAQVLGMFSVYLFLAVIGAFCDVSALNKLGSLGFTLFFMAFSAIFIHGLFTYGAARVMKMDLEMASVVSQANIGGGTSALALARSLGRQDLVLPAVLLGSFGNAIGTFLGFWVAEQILPWLAG